VRSRSASAKKVISKIEKDSEQELEEGECLSDDDD
jgi:hypothetical protein